MTRSGSLTRTNRMYPTFPLPVRRHALHRVLASAGTHALALGRHHGGELMAAVFTATLIARHSGAAVSVDSEKKNGGAEIMQWGYADGAH